MLPEATWLHDVHLNEHLIKNLNTNVEACLLSEVSCHKFATPDICAAVPQSATGGKFAPVRVPIYVLQKLVAMLLFALLSRVTFPPCHHSPDSAVRVLSPTGKTPESRSAVQNWRILGITHVWWRIHWERTTPLALLTSKAVSTLTPKQRVKQHRCTLLLL